jgi:hypothetical protein
LSFKDLVNQITQRFDAQHPGIPANGLTVGLVTHDLEQMTVYFDRHQVRAAEGVREADFIIYGTRAELKHLLTPDAPGRATLAEQLAIKPAYPYNNYLLSLFLNAFRLSIPDLDFSAKPFDGPFPFPPRYPVTQNSFRFSKYNPTALPGYDPQQLPELIADDHPEWVSMYHKAWQLAFQHLRVPQPQTGFVANFIDIPFNGNTFMWDACFMMLFGEYASNIFHFLGTLDNFYAKQHDDGFICRETSTRSGRDLFQSLDPRSTGPNMLAWTEWLCFLHGHDLERLRRIFPVLVGYHRWWKDWRTHPDGSYWTSGWGSGMDNQTRVPQSEYHHRHYTWVDATMQMALNCRMLLNIAQAIGSDEFDAELQAEYNHLTAYINTRLWHEASSFYYDAAPDGTLSQTKSIGAYWGLLCDVIPSDRAAQMIAHLDNPAVFNRPHRIPTQAYDSPVYNPHGGYWLGGVWSPTNYMVLRGLTERGYHALAYEIAHNHVSRVVQVFTETGTLWENYAPEEIKPGVPAGRDFVGWTGLSAINIPIEYLIGLRPKKDRLVWDIRLTGRHGVRRYPVSRTHHIDLMCEPRSRTSETALLTIKTATPMVLEIRSADQVSVFELSPGEHHRRVPAP